MLENLKAYALAIRPTFLYACKVGYLTEVKKYLPHWASLKEHTEIVKLLKEHTSTLSN
jgi:hypothetical protein